MCWELFHLRSKSYREDCIVFPTEWSNDLDEWKCFEMDGNVWHIWHWTCFVWSWSVTYSRRYHVPIQICCQSDDVYLNVLFFFMFSGVPRFCISFDSNQVELSWGRDVQPCSLPSPCISAVSVTKVGQVDSCPVLSYKVPFEAKHWSGQCCASFDMTLWNRGLKWKVDV